MTSILECRNLSVSYGATPTISNVSFTLGAGECLALVGASGSGKSTIARAVLGLHQQETQISGRLALAGHDVLTTAEPELAKLRGSLVGYVSQDPFAACDPLRSVGHHLGEAWRCRGMTPVQGRIVERLTAVGIENAQHFAAKAPHCWSGGMLQRACITAAQAHAPPLIVADEPTSALDADRADGILAALRTSGSAILLISHDLALVRRHADRVAILDAGQLVDCFPVAELDDSTRHEATQRLAKATFETRAKTSHSLGAVIASAQGISRTHTGASRTIGPISFEVRAGACIGLNGASGSGKSTILRMLAGLEKPDHGRIDIAPAQHRPGAIMPVFQNPTASLNPFWPIWRTVSEPATVTARIRKADRKALAHRLLARVGLQHVDIEARPNVFSLGQCQRIAIARAVAASPALLIADEPTSALDTISRAQIADLLDELVHDGMAMVIASHDPWVHNRLSAKVVRVS